LPSKRGAFDPAELPTDLSELIGCDASAHKQLGWHDLVNQRRPPATSCSWTIYLTQHNASCALMRIKVPRSSLQRHHELANKSNAPSSKARTALPFNTSTFFMRNLLT
jgi:hypothetical protein